MTGLGPRRLLLIAALLLVLNGLVWWAVLSPQAGRDAARQPTRTLGRTDMPTATAPRARATATAAPAQAPTPTNVGAPTPARGTSAAPTAVPKAAATAVPTALPTAAVKAVPTATPLPSLLTTVDEIAQATSSGRHGVPFRLVISDAQIKEALQQYLAADPDLAFSDVDVSLQTGEAVLTGRVRVLNVNAGFRATVTVVIVAGRPRLKVQKLELMGGLIPGFITDRVKGMIEERADLPILADLPVVIEAVEIRPGEAIVTGKTM